MTRTPRPRSRCSRRTAVCALLGLLFAAPGGAAQEAAPAEPPALSGDQLRNLPAPPFSLETLEGRPASLEAHAGWIVVLHFFEGPGGATEAWIEEMKHFHGLGRQEEIAYLGVSTLPPDELRSLARRHGIEYGLAHDPDGSVSRSYVGTAGGDGVFVLDHRGTVRFARIAAASGLRPSLLAVLSDLLRELRRALRDLPRLDLPWRAAPAMPVFSGVDLDGRRRSSDDVRGKPLLVVFLEHDCEHCRKIAPQVSEIYHRYHKQGVAFLGVATADPEGDLKRQLAIQGLPFPVILDPDRSIRRAFGAHRGSPDFVWIDPDGQVRWREFGAPSDLGTLLDLEAQLLLGIAGTDDIPAGRYLGYRYCRLCHEAETHDWLRTPHAVATLSLMAGNQWLKAECISCHVTGYKQPGGYEIASDAEMVHVQCESCHGAGGGHGAAADAARDTALRARCIGCHTGEWELQQELGVSLAWMNHRDTPDAETLFAYSPARASDVGRLERSRQATVTFRRGTGYVGSERCAPCHQALYDAWKATPHAHALETLRAEDRHDEPSCVSCHTTAYGELSGFRGTSTPALAGVGCESCHGPGADHVAEARPGARSIYGLASACPTCQTEAVCRTCHDPANDPDFRMPPDPGRVSHPLAPVP